jgi:murein DD-endopeptidase MepM/ murein hydrolase activator NlpD
MSFKFTSQRLLNGLFEPEGIYLSPPFAGEQPADQLWSDNADYYGQWNYNGVPLKGHPGVDFLMDAGSDILATDAGRVVEISVERDGLERYLKIEHRWGESVYALLGEIHVESGQSVSRGEVVASLPEDYPDSSDNPGASNRPGKRSFHFAVRIQPFNRYDGWGGFSDPLPYLPAGSVLLPEEANALVPQPGKAHPMVNDRPGLRRP